MTLQERHRRTAALKLSIRLARERMTVALAAMDYEAALACQVEIDDQAYQSEHRDNLDLIKASMRPVGPPSFLGVWRL